MNYYIIADSIKITPQFRNKKGELFFCPELGLGESERSEQQISIPYFVKSVENLLGTYELHTDAFFHKKENGNATDLYVKIDVGRTWGEPIYQFKVLGFEAVVYLPSIRVMHKKRQLNYAYFQVPREFQSLNIVLKKFFNCITLKTASFNYGSINYAGDEQIREILKLEDVVDPDTGFAKRCQVTEKDRTSLKGELNFVKLFKSVADLKEKMYKFEDDLEQASLMAKDLEQKAKAEESEYIGEIN